MKESKDTLVVSEIRKLDVDKITKSVLEEIFDYEREAYNRTDSATRNTNIRQIILRGFNNETS